MVFSRLIFLLKYINYDCLEVVPGSLNLHFQFPPYLVDWRHGHSNIYVLFSNEDVIAELCVSGAPEESLYNSLYL